MPCERDNKIEDIVHMSGYDYDAVSNPESWVFAEDREQAHVESTKHFTYKHSTFVFLVFMATLTMVITIVGSALGAHIYFGAKQAEDSYDDFDLSLVVDEVNNTAVLSNSCFECVSGPVYNPSDGSLVPNDQFIWRFKGRLRLRDSQRNNIQFPNGAFLGNVVTILTFRQQPVDSDSAYVRMFRRSQFSKNVFAPQRRLATWTTFSSLPTSAYSIVPETSAVASGDSTTGVCSETYADHDGAVYGAYESGGAKAVCTCMYDTSTTNSPATEYCMQLATNNPA